MDEDYGFIVDQMRWSFSRLSSFDTCKYMWKLTYIDGVKGEPNFYSQFGSFCHKILEKYYKGELAIFELADYYADHYLEEVTYDAPPNKYKDLGADYYAKGMSYFENFEDIDDKYEILGIEKQVKFEIAGKEFVGYIDLLLRDKETGAIKVVDHKSGSIKILKSGKISKSDTEHFLSFQRQLYLYSKAVIEEYGEVPKTLAWNLFRTGNVIETPFVREDYEAAIKWADETIKKIENERDWSPTPDDFFCRFICDHRNSACEWKPVYQPQGDSGANTEGANRESEGDAWRP